MITEKCRRFFQISANRFHCWWKSQSIDYSVQLFHVTSKLNSISELILSFEVTSTTLFNLCSFAMESRSRIGRWNPLVLGMAPRRRKIGQKGIKFMRLSERNTNYPCHLLVDAELERIPNGLTPIWDDGLWIFPAQAHLTSFFSEAILTVFVGLFLVGGSFFVERFMSIIFFNDILMLYVLCIFTLVQVP